LLVPRNIQRLTCGSGSSRDDPGVAVDSCILRTQFSVASVVLLKGRNILLLLGSLLLVLALAEVTVRMFVPVRMVGPSFTVYDSIVVNERGGMNMGGVCSAVCAALQFGT